MSENKVQIRLLTDNELDKIDSFLNRLDNAMTYGDEDPENILMNELPAMIRLWNRCNASYTAMVEMIKNSKSENGDGNE